MHGVCFALSRAGAFWDKDREKRRGKFSLSTSNDSTSISHNVIIMHITPKMLIEVIAGCVPLSTTELSKYGTRILGIMCR